MSKGTPNPVIYRKHVKRALAFYAAAHPSPIPFKADDCGRPRHSLWIRRTHFRGILWGIVNNRPLERRMGCR